MLKQEVPLGHRSASLRLDPHQTTRQVQSRFCPRIFPGLNTGPDSAPGQRLGMLSLTVEKQSGCPEGPSVDVNLIGRSTRPLEGQKNNGRTITINTLGEFAPSSLSAFFYLHACFQCQQKLTALKTVSYVVTSNKVQKPTTIERESKCPR